MMNAMQILKGHKNHSKPPVSLVGQLYWREWFYTVGHVTPNFDKMEGNPISKQVTKLSPCLACLYKITCQAFFVMAFPNAILCPSSFTGLMTIWLQLYMQMLCQLDGLRS